MALIGAAGAGKDTVGLYLHALHGAALYSTSDIIKQVFRTHYAHGQTEDWKVWATETQEGKASPHPYLTHDGTRPKLIREVLEDLGDVLQQVDPFVLVRPIIDARAATGRMVVDTSTRTTWQARYLKDRGGIVVLVSNKKAEEQAGKHHTARFWQTFKADFVVNNNGTLQELYDDIERVLLIHSRLHDPE